MQEFKNFDSGKASDRDLLKQIVQIHKYANEQYQFLTTIFIGFDMEKLSLAIMVGFYTMFLQVAYLVNITSSPPQQEDKLKKSFLLMAVLYLA